LRFMRSAMDGIRSGIRKIAYPVRYWSVYGFRPSPVFPGDLSGYRDVLSAISREKMYLPAGDVVEIGAFTGQGTYQLAKYFEKNAPGKKVIAVDIFMPSADTTANVNGRRMADIYAGKLAGREQRAIFDRVIRDCANVSVIEKDSLGMDFPVDEICFAYIDGNHSPRYVRNDFLITWRILVPGGWLAFDDYGRDLPGVTLEINRLIGEHAGQITKVMTVGSKTIFIQKRATDIGGEKRADIPGEGEPKGSVSHDP